MNLTEKKRRTYRGKWCDMTATTIAEFMGVHPSKAKRVLYAALEEFGESIYTDKNLMGMMIQQVRNREEIKDIKRYLC